MTFDATSTADEVLAGIDLNGKLIVVTGASGGLGYETARALATHGAHVVMAARDEVKNESAAQAIRDAHPGVHVEPIVLDLASLASVRSFVATFNARHDHLNILINNAGVMCTPFGRTADGFELQFGTNHLGHFLLTELLTPALLAGAPSRVVNLSSAGHRFGPVDFDDPNFDHRPYDGWRSYGQAKTANILHAVELDRRLAGHGVRAFAVHPGGIHTELGRYMTPDDLKQLGDRISQSTTAGRAFAWKTIPQGAATSVWAATSPDLDGIGGRYAEDCALAEPADPDSGSTGGFHAYAVDPDSARRLWELSERLVG